MAHSCFDVNAHAETLLLTHQQVRYRRCADHRRLDNQHGNLYEHQNPNGPRQFCRVMSDCLAVLLPQQCRQNLHLHPDCPTSSLALWSPAAPPPSLINGVSWNRHVHVYYNQLHLHHSSVVSAETGIHIYKVQVITNPTSITHLVSAERCMCMCAITTPPPSLINGISWKGMYMYTITCIRYKL